MEEEKEIQREPPQNEQADKQRPYIKVYDDFREYLGLKGNELDAFSIIYSFATQTKEKAYTGSSLHLAKRMKVKKDTARDILNRLSSKGYLIKKEGTNGSRNIYFLNQETISNLDPYEKQNSPTPKDKLPRISDYPEKRGTPAPNSGVLTTPKNGVHLPLKSGYSNINSNISSKINSKNSTQQVANESERDKPIQDNLPSKNEDDSMNEEVSQILNLYQEINPKFTPNDIERLIALIEEYPSNSIKKAMEKAKSRNTTSIGYIEKVLRNPITAKDTDKKDISPIDFVESNPVMKKCYDSLSELYIPSKQEEYSTCKELIKLWTNEQGNIKPETEIEAITERIKKAIEFFLPEYKKKIEAGNIQYVLSLHNFIAKAKWKDAERQQQAQSAKKEIEPEYTQEPIEEDLHSLKPLQH